MGKRPFNESKRWRWRFLPLNMLPYHTVKKEEGFIALGTLGRLKMGKVPQKAAEGQQDLTGIIMRFDMCTDKFT